VSLLQAHNVFFEWSSDTKMGPIQLDCASGEIIGLFGRSGTGKTTLFRLLAGELSPNEGTINYRGKGKRVYHDQLQKVIPWLSARKNSIFSMSEAQYRVRRSEVEHIFDICGISEFEKRDSTKLSGGQRARVALARSLLEPSDVLLLDEPFTGVDAVSQELIVQELREILGDKLTFITAHDPGILVLMSSKILCLKQEAGGVVSFFHEFRSSDFASLSPKERRQSEFYLTEVQALLESLYE